jgi:aconitate hydratase
VLSGNRNFEGRVTRDVRRTTSPRRRWSSPTRSPARMDIDLTTSRSAGQDGNPVYLKDIWPTKHEIQD